MERLNWIVLGLMGVVTALGLTTSSGAGKAKTGEQPASVTVTSNMHACDACRIAQAEAVTIIAASPIKSDEPCQGTCQAGGVCCDKGTTKSDPSSTAFVHDTQIICQGKCTNETKQQAATVAGSLEKLLQAKGPYVSGKEIDQAVAAAAGTEKAACADCPLAKAGDAVLNLTKNFVCEGGECLTKQGHGTLTITAVDPAAVKPTGLLNLIAAAETVKAQDLPAGDPICRNFTLTINGTPDAQGNTLTLNANTAEAKPTVDNSRAAARAAKLALLEKKMAEEISFNLNQNKLDDIVEQIRVEKRIEVQLDHRALEDMEFDTASPFDYVINNTGCGEALRAILHSKKLTWIIPESNDFILITSEAAAESTLLPRVYEVSDLIDEPGILMERIQAIVNPERWKSNGGQSDLSVWQSGEQAQLAVNCDFWTHRKLANFFEDLRAARAASPKRTAQAPAANLPVLRTYELPSLAQEKDATIRAKQYATWKGTLLQLLRETEGFDPALFETLEFGNRTVLITKQSPGVHHRIQKTMKMLEPAAGGGGVLPMGTMCF